MSDAEVRKLLVPTRGEKIEDGLEKTIDFTVDKARRGARWSKRNPLKAIGATVGVIGLSLGLYFGVPWAIEKYHELGSGFQIAFEDLQIRGAGNLLGQEQHGYIASVGFDLYCRLLKESIEHLKGEFTKTHETTLN